MSTPRRHTPRDQGDVTAMVHELGKTLFSRATRLAGNDWSDANDLVQDAYTKALREWDMVRGWPRDRQLAWLTTVMTSKKIDEWRKSKRRVTYPVAEVPDIRTAPSSESVALDRHALDQVDAVISAMPPARRNVAHLRWRCGWTNQEIAECLGIAAATVRGHVMRALQQLNEEVRPEVPFIDDVPDDDEEIPGEREEA